MVRNILFILVTLFTIPGQAQSWCPPGATWTYEAGMGLAGFNRMTYTHDTLIDGFTAQIIDQYSAIQFPQPPPGPTFGGPPNISYTPVAVITRSDSDAVYILTGAVWDTLYWFGAVPGDHWYPPHAPGADCDPITVADTGTTVIEGVALRRVVTMDGFTIIERIGSTWDMFIYCSNWIVDGPMGMRCYSDDEISYLLTSGACEVLMDVNEASASSSLMIYPNPGTDHFSLSLPHGAHTITLFDVMGRRVHQQQIINERASVQTTDLPSGIYLVKVDEGLKPLRWVKE